MSADVGLLAKQKTYSAGDGCRYRTCGPTRKHTRDVLTNLRGSISDTGFTTVPEMPAARPDEF